MTDLTPVLVVTPHPDDAEGGAGGAGAGPDGPGISALHTHMTNTRNTPIEALEHAAPLLVRTLRVARGTGGAGRHRGGDGLLKEIEFLEPCVVHLVADRRSRISARACPTGRPETVLPCARPPAHQGRPEMLNGCASSQG